ncbi:MAG: transcription termination/antitermination protein NusA [Clostridia bacterium]|nr:transcription termination/antitermination protein NusA [Clostridia bacterium]MBR0388285.1 transcription termination/antitermination protein NusA [Clostridia bacterium]MBR2601599.1 transcription termination/antitermination protein NusA [Clostridia bacterium]
MKSEVVEAIRMLAKEKEIDEDRLFAMIEEALKAAYRKNSPRNEAVPTMLDVHVDRETGAISVFAKKTIVEEVEMPTNQITLEEAQKLNPTYKMGDIAEVDVTPKGFLRVAAQTAKQVIIQSIREVERGKIYEEYSDKENEILTGIVQRIEPHVAYVDLGRTEGVLEQDQMIPGETLHDDDHIKVYVLEVQRHVSSVNYTPQVYVSRTHPNLVKRLFEMEVPEIAGGIVTIKNIAREAGSRTKIAVHSADLMIDPVGACVGQRGGRVERVVAELKGEKIDIIKWSSNPAEFVANALNPAHVLSVYQAKDEKAFRVIVPDNQLSLAIGKEGQNARLAAKLTGWKIDIKSQSQMAELNDMVDEEGKLVNYVQLETPVYDSFTMTYDDSVLGDDDTM